MRAPTLPRPLLPLPLLASLALATGCPPCGATDELCLVAEDLGPAILSVRALTDNDVWFVGTEEVPGSSGPAAWNHDGSSWEALDTSEWADYELWWSHPTSQRVTFVGSGGLLLEYDRADGTLERFEGPDERLTFFGVWGAGTGDVWAVGGDTNGEVPPAIWRRDSSGWHEFVDPVLGEGTPGELYFKVHGSGADDLWIVGNFGIALHWDGASLVRTPTDADTPTSSAPLLTVDASADPPVAVGGAASALILHWDGEEWRDHSPEFQPGVNGVCRRGDELRAVGQQGSYHAWNGTAWESTIQTVTLRDYHGCEVSPDGSVWAVGGQVTSRPLTAGVIAYEGRGGVVPPG